MVDIRDVITCFKFGDDRFRGLASAEGQILPFPPLTLTVVLTTLSHYRVSVWYSQSWQSEDTWSHLYEKFLCIRTYWKYTHVLFSKLKCTASIKSSRIVRYSDTNNIQSSHHRQAGTRSQRLERFHQSLRSSAYWRSRLPGKNVAATMTNICKTLTSLKFIVRTIWWYHFTKTAKIFLGNPRWGYAGGVHKLPHA